ncbi:hypothetical protein DPMN_194693 [Dreissena polymorpha]|uniref:Uncharacterized protein n=1 Tax=Dreissena polymorpha TaxID=45954 RepID=A0A9D3XY49_DREPO|nr:hypothetical protein DPMN_194693 [Dreissena polymorpha]
MNTAATLAAIYQYNNLRTKFHEDWAINVTSRVLISKAAPPPGGHIFQQTETIFKPSYHKKKYWTIYVTPRVLTSKTALPPSSHVFLLILTIFKLNRRIQEINVLTKFHEDWTKNVTLERSHKTAPPPGGHVFTDLDHFRTSKNVTSRVFTRNTAPAPWWPYWASNVTSTVFTIFELDRGIIGTNVLIKFHEDRTINVASIVFTRQMMTTDARRTKGDHNSSP